MKKTKKMLAVFLAVIMVAVVSIPAFAAEGKTYTITAPDNGHTYEVYQIFTGDYYDGVLSNIKWGQNGTGTHQHFWYLSSNAADGLLPCGGAESHLGGRQAACHQRPGQGNCHLRFINSDDRHNTDARDLFNDLIHDSFPLFVCFTCQPCRIEASGP